jgi:hypothetical protein
MPRCGPLRSHRFIQPHDGSISGLPIPAVKVSPEPITASKHICDIDRPPNDSELDHAAKPIQHTNYPPNTRGLFRCRREMPLH